MTGGHWCQAPTWGPRRDFYYCQTVAGLLIWGAHSNSQLALVTYSRGTDRAENTASNSSSGVACVSVASVTWRLSHRLMAYLQRRSLATAVSAGFTIVAFSRHATIGFQLFICMLGPGWLVEEYVGVLISLRLFLFSIFLFAVKPKEFFLGGLKKLEQRSCKCAELRGEYVE
jgi:hypothetical protein